MTVSNELVWLLNQLRNAASPKERLRLVALGYRTLRDLPLSDRRRVAQELGVEGAEQLVEQLARRGGASPAVLMEALRRLESADPDKLRGLVSGLIDPSRRSEIVERAVDGAAHWLTEEQGAPPPELDVRPAGPPDSPIEPELPAPESPPVAAPEAAAIAAVETAPAPRAPQDSVESAEVVVPEEAGPPADEPEPKPPVDHGGTPTRPAGSDAAVPIERSPAPDGIARSAAAVSGARSLLARLRELTLSVDRLAGAGQGELSDLLERFPSGWARRRALETLFRAGLPARIEDVLELVDTVGDEAGRMWALTTLVATRSLDAEEVGAVLDSAGSGAIERRIRSRLARSR